MKTLLLPFNKSIPLRDIIYLQSDGNYTEIYLRNKAANLVTAKSLGHIHEELNTTDFIRINRSQVINKNYMVSMTLENHYSTLKLKNGGTFKTSRRRTSQFLKAI